MKRILIAIALLLCAGAVLFMAFGRGGEAPEVPVTEAGMTQAEAEAAAERHVRENISTLSPEEEVLGGTFYVVDIEFAGERGRVTYEDGHNQFVADFEYSVSPSGRVDIRAFEVVRDTEEPLGESFDSTGNIVGGAGNWDLVYEEPGSPALRVDLVFTAKSTCDLGRGASSCESAGWDAGTRVRIEGQRSGDTVIVRRLVSQL